MQPHIWYYYIVGIIQSEDLKQTFSLHYSATYYWVVKLNIAINSVLNTTTCLKPLNVATLNQLYPTQNLNI